MPSSLLKNGSLLTRACSHTFHPEVLVLYTTQLPLNHKRKKMESFILFKCPINKNSYQICASKAEGRPVFKNNSLASTPETNPSMSLSVFKNISLYFILSAGDTIHY